VHDPYNWDGALLRSDTSHAALQQIKPHRSHLQRIVLDAIERMGGATCDAVEGRTGMSHQSCSARFTELRNAGAIYDSGERSLTRSGRSATVWRVRK